MLAIIRCLEEWRYLLEGVQGRFEIWSDHKNLEYFMSSQKLNKRQRERRWKENWNQWKHFLEQGNLKRGPCYKMFSRKETIRYITRKCWQ